TTGQELGKGGLTRRIDGPVQDILVEGGQEAVVGSSAAILEVFRRSGQRSRHLFIGATLGQKGREGGQPARIHAAVQVARKERLHDNGSVFLAVLDSGSDILARAAGVHESGPGCQTA